MLCGAVDREVAPRLAGCDQLGPDPRITRLERAVGQGGPEAPRRAVERVGARGIDGVVDRIDILGVRAELEPAAQVDRRVHGEAAVPRRVDRTAERRRTREREIAALHVVEARYAGRIVSLDLLRECVRAEPGGVDQPTAAHLLAPHAAHAHREALRRRDRALHRCAIGDVGAVLLRVGEQRLHELIGVDDAGGRRERSRDAEHLRLEPLRLGRRERHERVPAGEAVRARELEQTRERRQLIRLRRDEELAGAAVVDAALRAVAVERRPPRDAEERLPGVGRVVDPRVDHLAVARRRGGADARLALEDHHLAAALRLGARDREADHTRPDHHRVEHGGRAERAAHYCAGPLAWTRCPSLRSAASPITSASPPASPRLTTTRPSAAEPAVVSVWRRRRPSVTTQA